MSQINKGMLWTIMPWCLLVQVSDATDFSERSLGIQAWLRCRLCFFLLIFSSSSPCISTWLYRAGLRGRPATTLNKRMREGELPSLEHSWPCVFGDFKNFLPPLPPVCLFLAQGSFLFLRKTAYKILAKSFWVSKLLSKTIFCRFNM